MYNTISFWLEFSEFLKQHIYVRLTEWEGRHIAFGADHVGVGVGVVFVARVAHYLHSISWTNGFWPNLHRHIIGREERSD